MYAERQKANTFLDAVVTLLLLLPREIHTAAMVTVQDKAAVKEVRKDHRREKNRDETRVGAKQHDRIPSIAVMELTTISSTL